jgi:CRP/FNR family transcriptional regulator
MPETTRDPDEAVNRLLQRGGHLGQLLAALSPESQAEFRRLVRLKTVPARTTLVSEGEEASEIGYVLSGTLAMTKLLADGRVHIIGLLVPRDLYGRLFDGPYRYNIEAVSEAQLICLNRQAFERLLSQEAEAERLLLVQVIEELEASHEWILLLNGPKVMNRVASFLIILARRRLDHAAAPERPLEVQLPLSRNDLACYLGTRPETLSRTFHELADLGILRFLDPNHFEILDLSALLDASGQDLAWPEPVRAPR